MQAAEVLEILRQRGIYPESRRDAILLRPRSKVTPEVVDLVRQCKDELLATLSQKTSQLAGTAQRTQSIPFDRTSTHSTLASFQQHGISLQIDSDTGHLMLGHAGARTDDPSHPWNVMLMVIETNIDAVARLIEAGWRLQAGQDRPELWN